MRHNTYAVADTFYGRLFADYKVYLGDATTGAELVENQMAALSHGSAQVTFRWMRPCPYILQGDINSDCIVDFYDYVLLADEWRTAFSVPYWADETDINQSSVDLIDLYLLAQNWLINCQQTPSDPQCVIRPGPL